MILKKLRKNKNWSQEQLSILSGLSLRTVQRVEAGNTASLETLKSLASVFEINITKLTEEITVINKEAEEWKSVPIWVSMGIWGIRTRKTVLIFEKTSLLLGIIGFVGGSIFPPLFAFSVFFGAAYWYAVSIRWIDNANLWQ